jgi:hypothetical protein
LELRVQEKKAVLPTLQLGEIGLERAVDTPQQLMERGE